MEEFLFPLVAPRADLDNAFGRVKIQIHGDIANAIVPIYTKDPLNNRFHKRLFGTPNIDIRYAERI